MKFILTDTTWILEDLDPIEWTFLDRIPEMAAGEDLPPNLRQRILPDPIDVSAGEREEFEGLIADWNEFVRPDLEASFSEARDQVSRDLALASLEAPPQEPDADQPSDEDVAFADEFTARGGNVPPRVEVAREASEDWYSALNQARILMNEAHDIAAAMERFQWPEDGVEQEDHSPFDGTRILLMAQYEFYTALQSILIEVMSRSANFPEDNEADFPDEEIQEGEDDDVDAP